jgi:hypothetical protein
MDAKWIVNLSGRDYPLYAGILAEAHERGLQSIETTLIQVPGTENDYTAIVMAVVRLKDGSSFEDYGDASPRNTSARVATALIRMASTRAKGRALRDAINVGQTMLEELPDLEEQGSGESAGHGPHVAAAPLYRAEAPARERRGGVVAEAPSPAAAPSNGDGKLACNNPGCGKTLTKGQHDVSMQRFGQPLCPQCQKALAKAG